MNTDEEKTRNKWGNERQLVFVFTSSSFVFIRVHPCYPWLNFF